VVKQLIAISDILIESMAIAPKEPTADATGAGI
jgi:hypothetical protein